jgi:hypothetical protein
LNLSESIPTSAPIAQFGMNQVREQFHTIYNARAGPGVEPPGYWFPNSRFVGIDLSEGAIKFARVDSGTTRT